MSCCVSLQSKDEVSHWIARHCQSCKHKRYRVSRSHTVFYVLLPRQILKDLSILPTVMRTPCKKRKMITIRSVRLKYQSMKFTLCVVFLLLTSNVMGAQGTVAPAGFDVNAAERFANLALACLHKEYPNKLSHSLNSDADVAPPRKLTPAFFGCYDWHSSVYGHWLLVRLIRTFPDAAFTPSAREALAAKPDRREHCAGGGVPSR
jgi:Protein of unknown function (DUF2891)